MIEIITSPKRLYKWYANHLPFENINAKYPPETVT